MFCVLIGCLSAGGHGEPGQRGDRGGDGGERLVRVLRPGHHQHRAVRHRERVQTGRLLAALRHRHQHEGLADRQVMPGLRETSRVPQGGCLPLSSLPAAWREAAAAAAWSCWPLLPCSPPSSLNFKSVRV